MNQISEPDTPPRLLVTGAPGCGKTTLVQQVIQQVNLPAGGFYTRETQHKGQRTGFEIVTLDGKNAALANISPPGTHRIGRYFVDLHGLETIAIPALQKALSAGILVLIDEIGPMELLSAAFRKVVLEVLAGPAPVLGTIVKRPHPFTTPLKSRQDITLIELHPNNWETALLEIRQRLMLPGKY